MLETNQVYNGDCLEVMKDIDDNTIDLILTDLPYGIVACDWDIVIDIEALWQQYERIIKKSGVIVLFGKGLFSARLMVARPKLYRYTLIWKKPIPIGFLSANIKPLSAHEDILIFGESSGVYNPQMGKGKPYVKIRGNHLTSIYSKYKENNTVSNGDRYPTSVLEYNNVPKGNIHQTQKPIELIQYLIKTYSNEGDLVLDSCAGSGTTGEACLNTNRNFILIEKDVDFYEKCKLRCVVGATIKCVKWDKPDDTIVQYKII